METRVSCKKKNRKKNKHQQQNSVSTLTQIYINFHLTKIRIAFKSHSSVDFLSIMVYKFCYVSSNSSFVNFGYNIYFSSWLETTQVCKINKTHTHVWSTYGFNIYPNMNWICPYQSKNWAQKPELKTCVRKLLFSFNVS